MCIRDRASITQQIAANKALLKLETDKVAAKKAEQQALITEESKAKILCIQQETDKKIADAISVSYTHLDVYKRQWLNLTATLQRAFSKRMPIQSLRYRI